MIDSLIVIIAIFLGIEVAFRLCDWAYGVILNLPKPNSLEDVIKKEE